MNGRRGHSRRDGAPGFTIVELMFVVVIAGILLAIAGPRVGDAFTRNDVNAARDAVVFMANKSRTKALEMGHEIDFVLNVGAASAYMVDGTDTLDQVDVNEKWGVSATSTGSSYTECYSARGFANVSCSTVKDSAVVTFSRAGETASLVIWRLGQVRKQ